VEVKVLNGEGWVPAGNVTIPPNQQIPRVGAVVEVRYLYAIRESGCLYQPTYLGCRTDVEQLECLATQLKFKGDDDEA
jgi:bifunctional non-homologous end joining protein LigD